MKFISFCFLFLSLNFSNAQYFQWAKSFGGVNTEFVNSMCTDAAGNVYSLGSFINTVDFNPSPSIYNMAATTGNISDIYILKLDASGNFVWAKSFGGPDWDLPNSIVMDANGDLVITGSFGATADLNPGAGTFNFTAAGNYDAFVLKMDAGGNFIWAQKIGGANNDGIGDVITDNQSNIFLTGTFSGTIDLNPGTGVLNAVSTGTNADIFIEKLDATGNFIWGKSFGGSLNENCTSLALDAANNIYALGTFSGTVDFDPGVGILNKTSAGGNDIFIENFDNTGNILWAKTVGGVGDELSSEIKLDAQGDVYFSCSFQNTVDFDPSIQFFNIASYGGIDICLEKLSPLGNFIWAKSIGNTNDNFPKAMVINGHSNIFLTGELDGMVDFDPSFSSTYFLTSNGGTDFFIESLDKDGNFIWAESIGDTDYDYSYCLALDNSNNIFIGGIFGLTVDFNTLSSVTNLTSNGSKDVFVLKLIQGTAGVKENNAFDLKTMVYPNPTKDRITISSEETLDDVNLTLMNIAGVELMHKDHFNLNSEALDVSMLAPGVYFLKISSGKQSSVVKIVKV